MPCKTRTRYSLVPNLIVDERRGLLEECDHAADAVGPHVLVHRPLGDGKGVRRFGNRSLIRRISRDDPGVFFPRSRKRADYRETAIGQFEGGVVPWRGNAQSDRRLIVRLEGVHRVAGGVKCRAVHTNGVPTVDGRGNLAYTNGDSDSIGRDVGENRKDVGKQPLTLCVERLELIAEGDGVGRLEVGAILG